jgi:hypothetical protein
MGSVGMCMPGLAALSIADVALGAWSVFWMVATLRSIVGGRAQGGFFLNALSVLIGKVFVHERSLGLW